MSILASIYFLASILQSSAAASCWLPNGTEQNSTVTYVCPTDGASSIAMCCRSMDPSGDSGADRCIRAGDQPGQCLCQNDDGSVWRRGCSDQKWGSLGCLNLCAGQTNDYHGNIEADWDELVTPCDDGSFCCGPQSVGQSCCDLKQGYWIVNGTATKDKPPSTSTSVALLPATATSQIVSSIAAASATSTGENNNKDSCNSSAAAIGGGSAVGGLVVGTVASLLACLVVQKRRNRRSVSDPKIAEQDTKLPVALVSQKPEKESSTLPIRGTALPPAVSQTHEMEQPAPAELYNH